MTKNIIYLILLCAVIQTTPAWAQHTVRGTVTDFNEQAIIGATVHLQSLHDSLYCKREVTDKQGRFVIQQLKSGTYRLAISMRGYSAYHRDLNVTQETNIGTVHLLKESLNLQEVVIAAKQPATTLVGTTLVTTIPGSNLADLGNALDVLNQLPLIKVEGDVVNVMGKNNIEIYIDGRPMHNNQELLQLRSTNLKRVELLMVPGAAYATTTEAVLKITTKRDFIQGLSLTNQLQVKRHRDWSAMNHLSLNYQIGNWELFISGLINRDNPLIKGNTTNTLVYEGQKRIVGSSQNKSYLTTTGSVKSGFNYAKGTQYWGAYYQFNPEHGDFNNDGAEWLDNNLPLLRNIYKHIRAHSHFVSLYYENIFAGKYLLHFDGNFRQAHSNSGVTTTYPVSANPDVNSTEQRKKSLWAGKLYLKFPLKKGELTIGTQESYTHSRLDYRMLNTQVQQYIPSSLTDARQTSTAMFTSWSRMFGKLSLAVGARYEYVDYNFAVNGKHNADISHRNHLFTPDISLAYSFNDNSKVSLSYKMATVKPSYSQLTGSLSYTGLHEIEGGNPTLLDEKMHDIQLFGMWKGFILQTNFTRSDNAYTFVKQLYPADNLQLLMHPININLSALNLYLIWSKPVSYWTPNVTLGMYKQWLALGNTQYNKPIFSYSFDNTFSLPKGWLITANFNGQTQGDVRTNRLGTTWFVMNASVGKTFFNKSLTIKLTGNDLFNTVNNHWMMNTYGIHVNKYQHYDHRGVELHVIYHFQNRKSKYKGSSAAEEEMRRL